MAWKDMDKKYSKKVRHKYSALIYGLNEEEKKYGQNLQPKNTANKHGLKTQPLYTALQYMD
jgi:hypothetical protein